MLGVTEEGRKLVAVHIGSNTGTQISFFLPIKLKQSQGPEIFQVFKSPQFLLREESTPESGSVQPQSPSSSKSWPRIQSKN